jgi:hypothetical protein
MNEKRRRSRIDSLHLISYACLDENDEIISQGMGRTLNISELGILLETYFELDSKSVLLIDIGIKDDVVDLKGRVVHTKMNEEKKHETGIEFTEINDNSLMILKRFIEEFKKTAGMNEFPVQ